MLLHQRHYALVLRPDRRDRLNISLAAPPARETAALLAGPAADLDADTRAGC
jgi:hypothetical protein